MCMVRDGIDLRSEEQVRQYLTKFDCTQIDWGMGS